MYRYEVQEIASARDRVEYRVTDARTDSRIATCWVRENADLIARALNPRSILTPMVAQLAHAARQRFYSAKLSGMSDIAAFEELLRTVLEEYERARTGQ